MKRLLKLIISAMMVMGMPVMAANVLYLTTAETDSGAVNAVNNGYTGLQSVLNPMSDTLVDRRGVLSGTTVFSPGTTTALNQADIDAADIIVVMTIYKPVIANSTVDNYKPLNDFILNNPDKTVVIFTDGCCSQTSNINKFMATIKTGTGWNIASTYIPVNSSSPLNKNSVYASGFSVDPMVGGHYGSMSDVPGENALYLIPGAAAPANTDRINAYGFFVPRGAMNNGQGTCTFLLGDASPFPDKAQASNIIKDFMAAATSPTGACKRSSGAVDLQPAITGSTTATTGVPASINVNVNNLGATDSTNGTLTITLPVNLRVAGALPAGCTLVAGATDTTPQEISCNLSAIAAAGNTTLPLTVVTQQASSYTINAAITAVAGENVTSNNTAAFVLTATTPPPADLTPSLGGVTALTVNTPSTLDVAINNLGGSNAASGTLTITLPVGLRIAGTSLPAGCSIASGTASTAQAITCSLANIAAGASTSLGLPIVADQAGSFSVSATISNVPAETVTSNNSATYTLSATAIPPVQVAQPVPLGGWPVLLLLAGLLPLAVRRRLG